MPLSDEEVRVIRQEFKTRYLTREDGKRWPWRFSLSTVTVLDMEYARQRRHGEDRAVVAQELKGQGVDPDAPCFKVGVIENLYSDEMLPAEFRGVKIWAWRHPSGYRFAAKKDS